MSLAGQKHSRDPENADSSDNPSKKHQSNENAATSSSSSSSTLSVDEQLAAAREQIQQLQSEISGLKSELSDAKTRESSLFHKLTQRENDINELEVQLKDTRQLTSQRAMQMRTTFMDPFINENFKLLRDELTQTQKELQSSKEDLRAAKFTPHSTTGRQLMAKCRQLQEENEEFGRQLDDGRIHQLERELELQKTYSEELTRDLDEYKNWIYELNEETEAMETHIRRLETRLSKYEAPEDIPPDLDEEEEKKEMDGAETAENPDNPTDTSQSKGGSGTAPSADDNVTMVPAASS